MTLQKSRKQILTRNDLGGYRLINSRHNSLVAGGNFDLTIEDVFRWLED